MTNHAQGGGWDNYPTTIVGNVTTVPYNSPYTGGNTFDYGQLQQSQYVWTWPASVCSGDTHVWACSHAKQCKCGKATRELPVCPSCGK